MVNTNCETFNILRHCPFTERMNFTESPTSSLDSNNLEPSLIMRSAITIRFLETKLWKYGSLYFENSHLKIKASKSESGLASNIKILVSKLAIFGPVDKNATVPGPTKKQCERGASIPIGSSLIYVGTKDCSLPKKLDCLTQERPYLLQNMHFWPFLENKGLSGPFRSPIDLFVAGCGGGLLLRQNTS